MHEFLAKYMPPNYSEHGADFDRLSEYVHWLMLLLFIAWGALIIYMLFRFRASRNPKASYVGATTHASSYAEAGVAVVEVILLLGFSIPAWYRWTSRPPAAKNPMEIRVVAEQFAWNIHYPGADNKFGRTDVKLVSSNNPLGIDTTDPNATDDVATINQLHLQLNRPVIIRISSKDVIHSFFLPVMRVKQDAIPGMEIPVHFTPIKAIEQGEKWEIACAQLCGLGHYRMKGMLFVHNQQNFNKWMHDEVPYAKAASGG
jgi:cytochrome c oxidase subunit 2